MVKNGKITLLGENNIGNIAAHKNCPIVFPKGINTKKADHEVCYFYN